MLDYTPTLRGQPVLLSQVQKETPKADQLTKPTIIESILLRKQQAFALNAAKLIMYIYSQGYECTFGDAFRTHEQAQIYAKIGSGIVNSKHCERLALDLNLFKDGKYVFDEKEWEQFGIYWEKLCVHNVWGGRFVHRNDPNHVESD